MRVGIWKNGYVYAKCSDTEYNAAPWEWRTLGVAGGPWEWRAQT